MITKERFKQLWDALVEDRVASVDSEVAENAACSLVSSNGVSEQLKKALLANEGSAGQCLASNVPGDWNWK